MICISCAHENNDHDTSGICLVEGCLSCLGYVDAPAANIGPEDLSGLIGALRGYRKHDPDGPGYAATLMRRAADALEAAPASSVSRESASALKWVQPGEETMWTPTDCIRALCTLTEEICKTIGYSHPSDCFCGFGGLGAGGTLDPERYRHDGTTIRFIQEAVREKLAGALSGPDAKGETK